MSLNNGKKTWVGKKNSGTYRIRYYSKTYAGY